MTIAQIPTGYGKSHVLNLAAINLLMKGMKVILVFSNEFIMKRDLELFEPIYQTMKTGSIEKIARNFKKDIILNTLESKKEADKRVLLDEIDHAYFMDITNMALL